MTTRVCSVVECIQVCSFDDGENRREKCQSQHESDLQFLLHLELQLPESVYRDNRKDEVGKDSEAADDIGRVVEDMRTPAFSFLFAD